jgi:hypothetical protein
LDGDITPNLHGHQVTLVKHGGSCKLPPTGVFNWHYLQCVIKWFGTDEYKNFMNVSYYVLPFKTDDDDDSHDEYNDNDESDPPYPTYRFDRYLEQQGERWRIAEKNREVVAWREELVSQDH